ncbi:hypothetical protein X740_28490 [Mesorhizobium sp. LNHC221B00]|uniref:DUF768 domain-containing protein n=1 Tax=Mesorhizobium sp. LNHC221B00 TaxID=1287233 RepID=UPI0003CE82BB|nr:DUF768 domain-containing protein [Mesorhizobium sp. LNHC221B00]ESY76564.1 hypothetical protein X740_28490 [Mesorhizobium sp. LNHC221B00]
MSKRGGDFLYHWMSDHLADGPINDPVLLVIDMAEAKQAAEAPGIPGDEIDEEIGELVRNHHEGIAGRHASPLRGRLMLGSPRVRQGVANMQHRRHL